MRQDTKLEIFGAEMFAEILSQPDNPLPKIERLLQWGNDEDVVTLVLYATNSKEIDFSIYTNGSRSIIGGIIKHDTGWSTHT